MLSRRALCASLLIVGSLAFSPSHAESAWPSKPIHIIVPLPAGSAADVVARLIGKGLAAKLNATVVVDNREGASGVIGTSAIAQATADGYTLGIATTTTLITAPILNKKTPYNAEKDFTPIAMVGYSPYVLVTNPSVPAKSISEFIALAKSRPGQLTYSSEGEASLSKLAVELLSRQAGITLNEIPYKSSTQAVVDLISGQIDSQFGILTTTYQFIRDHKLNALGVTTLKRIPEYPKIPTIAESGFPGYEVSLWIAVIAPANLPENITNKLNQTVNAILADSHNNKILSNQAIFANPLSPPELGAKIAAETKKWKSLAPQTTH